MSSVSDNQPVSRLDRALRLTWRRLGVVLVAWVAAVVAHNLAYGVLYTRFPEGWDEPFFFVLATLVIPAYFIAALVYTAAAALRKRL